MLGVSMGKKMAASKMKRPSWAVREVLEGGREEEVLR